MQIIKRSTLQVGSVNLRPFITVNEDHVYFTKAACNAFNLKHNCCIVFINDARAWSFYQTTETDSFLLQRFSGGLRIHCKPLCRLLLKQLTAEPGISFHLEMRGDYHGHDIIHILTGQAVQKI